MYEDDNNMRVLGEEEIRHIFTEDEAEEEVQVGDIVSAIWLPNGQWYDAKVLQKGSEFLQSTQTNNASWCAGACVPPSIVLA